MKKLASVIFSGTLIFGVAACGSDDDGGATSAAEGSSSDASSDAREEAGHNDADVTFTQMMIPHHEGAVDMAEMALEKAESPDVVDLAERIKAAQGPEIEELEGWLEEWGEEPDSDMGGMDHSSGMMSVEDMSALESLDGAVFDQRFLTMMKEHHQGAIDMAETELGDGEYPPALELAQEIIDTQTAEIEEIDDLLASA